LIIDAGDALGLYPVLLSPKTCYWRTN